MHEPEHAQPTPPGWYADKFGTMRWWDGRSWTEFTQPPQDSVQWHSDRPPPANQRQQTQRGSLSHGRPATKKWHEKPVFWVVGGGFFLILLVIGLATQTTDGVPAAMNEELDNKIEVDQILEEYDENELAADSKFLGKEITITGTVAEIDTEILNDDKYILRIGDGGALNFTTIDCYDLPTSDLKRVKVNEEVTVRATVEDGGDLGVDVGDCQLLDP